MNVRKKNPQVSENIEILSPYRPTIRKVCDYYESLHSTQLYELSYLTLIFQKSSTFNLQP